MTQCKKCLLLEAGEEASYKSLEEYISTLNDSLKVNNDVYASRLDKCKNCDNLISGMCLKCGCYVELRAILKDKHCPSYDEKLW